MNNEHSSTLLDVQKHGHRAITPLRVIQNALFSHRKFFLLFCLAAMGLLCACGKEPYNHDFERFARPPLIRPKAGKAIVYFYRGYSMYPTVNYYVNDGNKRIGGLSTGTFFYHYADPGRHGYWGQLDFRNDLVLDVEAGRTYYVKSDLELDSMGMPHKPSFREVSEEEARGDMAKLTYAIVH
jgi:hypothetical protein